VGHQLGMLYQGLAGQTLQVVRRRASPQRRVRIGGLDDQVGMQQLPEAARLPAEKARAQRDSGAIQPGGLGRIPGRCPALAADRPGQDGRDEAATARSRTVAAMPLPGWGQQARYAL
jgi:hypothetical protein